MDKIFQFEPNLGEEEKKELVSVIDSGWYTEAGKQENLKRCLQSLLGENLQLLQLVEQLHYVLPVSYTHLTLPTKA